MGARRGEGGQRQEGKNAQDGASEQPGPSGGEEDGGGQDEAREGQEDPVDGRLAGPEAAREGGSAEEQGRLGGDQEERSEDHGALPAARNWSAASQAITAAVAGGQDREPWPKTA